MSRPRGFTLMEVLVALAVVALALGALVKAGGATAAHLAHLQEKTWAQWIAADRLTELRLERAWPAVGSRRERVERHGLEWVRVETVQSTPVETMRRIEIAVFPADGDEDHPLVTLVGFLPDPKLLRVDGPQV
ncbi:MAG: type II secretion system protein I [Gammaproteobacteria bacterium]|nr:MAG: type II secretion system protein I [Gammaproteobacteria bacterium]